MSHIEHSVLKIVVVETVIAVIFSVAFSGLFAWLLFAGVESIGLWQPNGGLIGDLVPTIFMSAFMITAIVTRIIRGRHKNDRFRTVSFYVPSWAPHNAAARGLVYALVYTVIFLPTTALALASSDFAPVGYDTYFAFKLVYGALLGIAVTPLAIMTALADLAGKKY